MTTRRATTRGRAASGLRAALVAVACALLLPSSSGDATRPGHPAGAAVRVEAHAGARIAGVVVWPPVSTLVSEEVSRAALAAAVRVALVTATPRAGEPFALFLDEGGTLAAGFELAGGAEDALVSALAAVAEPGRPGPARLERALGEARRSPGAERPPEGARRAVLDRLAGLDAEERDVDAAEVARALARLRRSPVRVVAVGGAGLSDRVTSRLGARIGMPPPRAARPRASERETVLLPGSSESALLVLGFRVPAPLAGELGSAVPVVAEVLREGPGSLRQRLSVAVEAPSEVRASLRPLDGGNDGALLVEVEVPAVRAERALEVLDGAIASFGALPPREAALVDARARLDASAAALRGDAAAMVLRRLLLPASWAWPPPDRWSAPLRPDAFARAARRVLARERSAIAVAGRVPPSLAARTRVAARPSSPRAGPDAAAAEPGSLLARIARRVLPDGVPDVEEGFASRYEVIESTPLGAVRAAVEVIRQGDEVDVVREGPETPRRGRAASGSPARPGQERRLAVAMRQPATLVALAERGFADVDETRLSCGASSCPTLVAELEDGTRLELLVDGTTFEPVELRTRWCCGDLSEPADETLRYLSWIENRGVRLAARMRAEDASGGERELSLVEWAWVDAATGPSGSLRDDPR